MEKRSKCDGNIHNSMIILVDIYQINKRFFIAVQPKYSCKLEPRYSATVIFIYQPLSDIVVFQ